MSGARPLTFTDLVHWIEVRDPGVAREEVPILLDMDAAYLAQVKQEREDRKQREKEAKAGSGGRIIPASTYRSRRR